MINSNQPHDVDNNKFSIQIRNIKNYSFPISEKFFKFISWILYTAALKAAYDYSKNDFYRYIFFLSASILTVCVLSSLLSECRYFIQGTFFNKFPPEDNCSTASERLKITEKTLSIILLVFILFFISGYDQHCFLDNIFGSFKR